MTTRTSRLALAAGVAAAASRLALGARPDAGDAAAGSGERPAVVQKLGITPTADQLEEIFSKTVGPSST